MLPSSITMILSALLLTLLWSRHVEAQANVCLILYQMADNNLEQFLRDDNYELIQSPAIRQKSLTTWVYFDGRNYRGDFEDISEPLAEVFNADGTPVTVKETGSNYLTWNHTMQKMVVERTLAGEVNGDNPQVVYNFVTTALRDCIIRGSTEFMIVFASHGGGFDGFGGDENPGRRRLIQNNVHLAAALSRALNDVPSAPAKFDVFGFDSCLMQAFGAVDDYRRVAKYFLASESIVPGHGLAYNFLNTAKSALDMALNFHQNFLQRMQGNFHETPKTMAIVETQTFTRFLRAWEALCAEFNVLLGKDLEFMANLRRARANSLAFESVIDFPGTSTPSAVDIGDFLFQLQTLCVPSPGSLLKSLITNAQAAYDSMFIARGVGPGTPPSTGMHITWPLLTLYQEDPGYFSPLFDTTLPSVTTAAPNFLEFLWNYLNVNTPAFTVGTSVCTTACSSSQPESEGQLLLNPDLVITDTTSTVRSRITCSTDQVSVEFGIDLSSLGNERRFRELLTSIEPIRGQTQDKFVFYGGNVPGIYEPPSFSATWDNKFFLISDNTSLDFVYVEDSGDGFKKVPVVYFSSSNPVTSNDIPTGTFFEEAVALGGASGYLYFTTGQTSDTIVNLALYTESAEFGTLSQTPLEAGGFISPIVYARANGLTKAFVGGLLETVIPWNKANTMKFVTANAETIVGLFGVSTIALDMIAYDYNVLNPSTGAGVDYASFAIDVSNEVVAASAASPVASPPVSPPVSFTAHSSALEASETSKAPAAGVPVVATLTIFFFAFGWPLILGKV